MCMSKAYLFFFFTLGGVKIFFSGQRECCVLKPAASPERFANTLVVCFTFLEQIQDFKNTNWIHPINVIHSCHPFMSFREHLGSLRIPEPCSHCLSLSTWILATDHSPASPLFPVSKGHEWGDRGTRLWEAAVQKAPCGLHILVVTPLGNAHF